ncbi:MAG: class I SAM-dependent methyltransferase [Thermoplasmata archaeon]|nr:class I SAM-dependent methyltransferase [Thermoplasmata archaeon]
MPALRELRDRRRVAPRALPPLRYDPGEEASSPRERYVAADEYRVEREWRRYEGTAQRDLFRELRGRFLRRHPPAVPGAVLEVGSGPGRFSPLIGDRDHPRVLFDLSDRMLHRAAETLDGAEPGERSVPTEFVRGDATRLPFRDDRFSGVVALGNVVGFGGERASTILQELVRCASPDGGIVVLEFAVGAGERAEYLHRLPPGAVRRLLRSPVRALHPRVHLQPFRPFAPVEKANPSEFQRWSLAQIESRLADHRLEVIERLAVAPCLGADPERAAGVQQDPVAWSHLLELEEAVGREPERLRRASALLIAARRTPRQSKGMIK